MLGLPPTATKEEVKNAFRKMALLHHPDLHAASSEAVKKQAEATFKSLIEAYQTIVDGANSPFELIQIIRCAPIITGTEANSLHACMQEIIDIDNLQVQEELGFGAEAPPTPHPATASTDTRQREAVLEDHLLLTPAISCAHSWKVDQ